MSGSTTRTVSVVPLISAPQTLSISLNGVIYNLTVTWNVPSQAWLLDIADTNGNNLLNGAPLVTGCDLLEQYAYVGIGGSLYVLSSGDVTAMPTFLDLGTQSNLYFVTPQDIPPT